MDYKVPNEELARYLLERWERLPEEAKSLLNLRDDKQAQLFMLLLWETQYWRALYA